jgi:hypothetical protein
MNGIFTGTGPDVIHYGVDKNGLRKVGETNLIKVLQDNF